MIKHRSRLRCSSDYIERDTAVLQLHIWSSLSPLFPFSVLFLNGPGLWWPQVDVSGNGFTAISHPTRHCSSRTSLSLSPFININSFLAYQCIPYLVISCLRARARRLFFPSLLPAAQPMTNIVAERRISTWGSSDVLWEDSFNTHERRSATAVDDRRKHQTSEWSTHLPQAKWFASCLYPPVSGVLLIDRLISGEKSFPLIYSPTSQDST